MNNWRDLYPIFLIIMTRQDDLSRIRVAFVCLGNICRSPLAHHIFEAYVKRECPDLYARLIIDSAGTGGHTNGCAADPRSIEAVRSQAVGQMQQALQGMMRHKAKKITKEMIMEFDYILVMDEENYADVLYEHRRLASKLKDSSLLRPLDQRLLFFGNFLQYASGVSNGKRNIIIEDPYYGDQADFDDTYEKCLQASVGLANHLHSLQ